MCDKHLQLLNCSAYKLPDLHSMNISFSLPDIDAWTVEQINECFGEPRMNKVSRLDHQPLGPEVPPYTVESTYFFSPDETPPSKQIKIMDFGEASFSNEKRVTSRTPILLRSPEALFGESIGLPADIWAFACSVFDIFGERTLFESFIKNKDTVLLEMISTLGMLPDRWWKNWEARRFYLLDDGTWNPNTMTQDHESKSLALRIQQMRHTRSGELVEGSGQLNAEDLTGLQTLLASLLRYEPSERLTAEEIVKSDWVQRMLLGRQFDLISSSLHSITSPVGFSNN